MPVQAHKGSSVLSRTDIIERFKDTRRQTEALCRPLETEDYVVQTIEDVSPPKWHLGHTTWFFERVILQEYQPSFKPYDEKFYFVFNSYYNTFGPRVVRDRRGTLSRPTVAQVMAYRQQVTQRTIDLLENVSMDVWPKLVDLMMVGINHEQQHQELMLTDVKHILASNPLMPVYADRPNMPPVSEMSEVDFIEFPGGLHEIGAKPGEFDFVYDNEFPLHQQYVQPFKLADRPVTNGEFLEFIESGGYGDHRWWLSDGWDVVNNEKWDAPLYWHKEDSEWQIMTLSGMKTLDPHEPLCHASFFEAAAYARWKGMRLPTEAEWELAARTQEIDDRRGSFVDDKTYHPVARVDGSGAGRFARLFGDCWEWTLSAYNPYPGYKASVDGLGEYNGKFMNAQRVLRGGSCATPRNHIRPTYRNFFQSEKRWQFTGFRLADDL